MLAPKIKYVYPLPDCLLKVEFVNEQQKINDCKPLLEKEVFAKLQNPVFFKTVKVDNGGYGIVWDDDCDISEYELWTNGIDSE